MRATVLLLSVDEAPRLRHSLPAALAQPESDVVVIDNASTDDTAAVAAEHGARVISLSQRVHYPAAINAGIGGTEGDAVLFLNADCVLDPGFLQAALPRLAEPHVGSVAPRLLRARGPEPADRLDEIDAAGMVVDRRRKNTLVGHGRPSSGFTTPGPAFGADGAAALYRRETLEECAQEGQYLDDAFVLWASDVDLAWRARTLGWRCAYEPAALAWHERFYSPSTRGDVGESHRRLQFRNRYLMMAKNDTARDLFRDAPRILAWEVLALGHVLLRERHLLIAYGEAAREWRPARRRGAATRRRRCAQRVPFGLEPPDR